MGGNQLMVKESSGKMYENEHLTGFPCTLNAPKLTCAEVQEHRYKQRENLISCPLSALRAASLPAPYPLGGR